MFSRYLKEFKPAKAIGYSMRKEIIAKKGMRLTLQYSGMTIQHSLIFATRLPPDPSDLVQRNSYNSVVIVTSMRHAE